MRDLNSSPLGSNHYAGLRPDWFRSGIIAGFSATFAMTATLTAGYFLARSLGDENGSGFTRWMDNLSANKLTDRLDGQFGWVMIANLVIGLAWALLYARVVEPASQRSGIREGLTFSIIPFLCSVLIFFPIAGAGFLGMNLDAGPLPVIGNLVVHLVFGAVLGFLFAIEQDAWVGTSENEHNAAESAERDAVLGMAIGGVVGLVGGWFVGPSLIDIAGKPVIALAGGLSGAAIGTMVGSLMSLSNATDADAAPAVTPRSTISSQDV